MTWKPIINGKRGDVEENRNTLLAKFEDGRALNWAIGYWGYHWLNGSTFKGRKWIHNLDMTTVNYIRSGDSDRSISQETLPLHFEPTHYMEIHATLESNTNE